MRAVIALFLVGLVLCSATDFKEDKNVLVLGDKDLDEAVQTYDHLLVEFCKFPSRRVGGVNLQRVYQLCTCAVLLYLFVK